MTQSTMGTLKVLRDDLSLWLNPPDLNTFKLRLDGLAVPVP
jgi:hypothetical protein